jgi:AraC family transcriptional regulator, positive regulator of tynA and feaB
MRPGVPPAPASAASSLSRCRRPGIVARLRSGTQRPGSRAPRGMKHMAQAGRGQPTVAGSGTVLPAPAIQRWSTDGVRPDEALEYWVDTVCRSFLEIEIDSPARHDFRARITQASLGSASLHLLEAEPQRVRRTPDRIGRAAPSFFLLQLQAGRARLNQYGRDAQMAAGDCVLIDCNAPYDMECLSATRSLVLRFQRDWLCAFLPAPDRVAARPFTPDAGWRAALAAALSAIDVETVHELALPAEAVAEQIAALLALAAGPAAAADRRQDRLQAAFLRSLRDRSHEPDLTPAAIAAAHGVSTRQLHHVFSAGRTTFGLELMRLRLERAHRLLQDPRFEALPVGEIAARCGFVAPSHFARRFRQAFGLSPTDFRSRQLRIRS